MGEILQTKSSMVTDAEDPASLSECKVCQSTSKVRAVCGTGEFVGMSTFGASAPFDQLYKHFKITAEQIAAQVKLLKS